MFQNNAFQTPAEDGFEMITLPLETRTETVNLDELRTNAMTIEASITETVELDFSPGQVANPPVITAELLMPGAGISQITRRVFNLQSLTLRVQ